MCTAVTFSKGFYGRNLDLEYELPNSKVVITPRNYKLYFKANNQPIKIKYGMIGMAMVVDNYPLYYDAMNEHGLFAAGLNFTGFAKFNGIQDNKNNVTPFELIPFILGSCKKIDEVKELVKDLNLINIQFNDHLSLTPLHWIISDENKSIVIESVESGLKIFDNPLGVLTNNPGFEFHLMNMNNYIGLNPSNPSSDFSNKIDLKNLSNGIGTTGLPGGLSSTDRFVRATYTKMTASVEKNEIDNITQFFHILGSVNQVKGTVLAHENRLEKTIYSSCCSKQTKSYYYKMYSNSQINCISLSDSNLNSSNLTIHNLVDKQAINYIK